MAPSTPEEALAFFSALPPSSIRLGLDRIQAALDALGNPEAALPALHVAGTNGKGSTCAFAESCLRAQGLKVGLYTSPHLERVNERIKIGGVDIPDGLLGRRIIEVLERYPAAAREPFPLTYFELGTVVAFWHFAREAVDVAVLETGLGGRLDATTACHPWVTAITSLSLDHTELLGSTLEAIAGEKAGIFKPGVPAVVSRQAPEAARVLEAKAAALGAPLWTCGRDFGMEPAGGDVLRYRGRRTLEGLRLGLRGAHQAQNAAVALACLERLEDRGLKLTDRALREGLEAVRWPGRLEELATSPTVLLDGAHNPGGVEVLVNALEGLYAGRRVHLVFGVLADKDHGPMMRALFPRCASLHLTPVPSPRTLVPEAYAGLAGTLCPEVHTYGGIAQALSAARQRAAPGELVLCAGSLYLVGAVRSLLRSAR